MNRDIERGDFVVVGVDDSFNYAAISKKAPEALKRKMLATCLAYSLGLRDASYAERRYLSNWSSPKLPKQIIVIDEIVGPVSMYLDDFFADMEVVHRSAPEILGCFAADVALHRCAATFDVVYYLLRMGASIEAEMLCRMILEQMSWAAAVYKCDDPVEIDKKKPQRCISCLKRIYPRSERLYGHLSRAAHLSVRDRRDYFEVIENRPSVILRNPDRSVRMAPRT